MLYDELARKMNKRLEYRLDIWKKRGSKWEAPDIHSFTPDEFNFWIHETIKLLSEFQTEELEFILSNLVSVWVLRWEAEAEWEGEKSDTNPDDTSLDITVHIYNTNYFVFTPIGYRLLKICK